MLFLNHMRCVNITNVKILNTAEVYAVHQLTIILNDHTLLTH